MLIGNVGKDPEVHFTPSGVKVAQLRLATSETWKDKDGAVQEHTDWHTIIAWRGLADVVERLVRRGSRLYRDGNKKYVTEIIADSLLVLDAKRQDQPANTNETEQSLHTSSGTDVIPF
jgi:single-strand DNA-binding protein